MSNESAATKVVTGPNTRLSYVSVFKPQAPMAGQQGDPKYQVTLLIPKEDTETVAKIQAAIRAAAQAGKETKFGGKIPNPLKHTLRDGDTDDTADGKEGYAGHYFMRVSSKTKPGVVDENLNPIIDETEVYSGCYARVSINAYPFNTSGNKGVSFGLNNLMKTKDGESLGGKARAEEDFAEFAGAGAPAAAASSGGSDDSVDIDLF